MLNPPMYAREATLHFGGSVSHGTDQKTKDKQLFWRVEDKRVVDQLNGPSLVEPSLDSYPLTGRLRRFTDVHQPLAVWLASPVGLFFC